MMYRHSIRLDNNLQLTAALNVFVVMVVVFPVNNYNVNLVSSVTIRQHKLLVYITFETFASQPEPV